MYSSPSRRCRSLISYADHPRRWLTRRVLSYSRLAADYLWLAIAKAVGRCPGRLKLFDAAKVRVGGIKQLQSFERRQEWRDLTRDKLTVGIGFHTRTLPTLPPLVSVYRFPTICSEAVCPHTAYQIVVGGQTALQTVVCPVLGTITAKSIWPIPNTGMVRTLVYMIITTICETVIIHVCNCARNLFQQVGINWITRVTGVARWHFPLLGSVLWVYFSALTLVGWETGRKYCRNNCTPKGSLPEQAKDET